MSLILQMNTAVMLKIPLQNISPRRKYIFFSKLEKVQPSIFKIAQETSQRSRLVWRRLSDWIRWE